jgi:hypothetical protein
MLLEPKVPENYKLELIDKALTKYEYKMSDPSKFNREDLQKFFDKHFKLQVHRSILTEGIYFSRGENLDKSTKNNRQKLLRWLSLRLPTLLQQQNVRENKVFDRKDVLANQVNLKQQYPKDDISEKALFATTQLKKIA